MVVAFIIGGLVKGLIGGGLPSIVVPIMAVVVDPVFAAAVTLIPVAVTNVWQVLDERLLGTVLRRFWSFFLTLAAGVALGSQILVRLPPESAALLIGIAVVCLSPAPMVAHRLALTSRREAMLNPLMGSAIGVLGGATVIFTPALVYLAALRLDKSLYVAAAAATAICSLVPLYLGLGFSAALSAEIVRLSLALLAPTMVGYLAGRALRTLIPQRVFQGILTVSLVLLGIGLIYKAAS